MGASATATVDFLVQDVTGQKRVRASKVPGDMTVREMVQSLLGKMGLVRRGLDGQPLHYRARLDREGRHLHDSELVADVLEPDDEIVLQPRINAG